jgi:hypothetical protein
MHIFSQSILALLAATCPLLSVEPDPQLSKLYDGSTLPTPILHTNNTYAWSGIYPNGIYSSERAFFHENGTLAWGGLSQERQRWSSSDKAFFYYDNGQKAWGGLHQSRQRWFSEDGKFYHSNGQLAWGGLDQQEQWWTSDSGKIYHANGTVAWSGVMGSPVYYDNGQMAWKGTSKSAVYDDTGKFISLADYAQVQLGGGSWLYVFSDRQFELILNLGVGYNLRIKNHGVWMNLYGAIYDITNDF